MKTVNFFIVALIGAISIAAIGPAHALRPNVTKPENCKSFIHGNAGKAWTQSKAKQRARGKWETRALFEAGLKFNNWGIAKDKHYDCSKHGKWYHCMAAAYPCKFPF
jgi:hypothetical protein